MVCYVLWGTGLGHETQLLADAAADSFEDALKIGVRLEKMSFDFKKNSEVKKMILNRFRSIGILRLQSIPTLLGILLLTTPQVLHSADTTSLQSPKHLGMPLAEHAATNRAFSGIPSLAVAPKGRLWATWYAGVTPGEDANNYVVISTSEDHGRTWTEVLTVDPDGRGPVRSFDPELWLSPDGRLFHFWAQMDKSRRDAELGVWYIETSEPNSANPTWSQPRRIGDGVMMCKPIALSTGEWVLPISKWREHDYSAQMIVSSDAGKTWSLRGACNVPLADRQYDEHMFVERRDGSLWLLVRTKYGIGESVSTDGGKTWPDVTPSAIQHPTSRFFISRLVSGNMLLVKHGPMDARISRSHLTAYISKDDGRTWSGGLMLDERLGVSYPDGQQTPDGLIRIIYDYNRVTDRNILMAMFREEDAFAGNEVSADVKLRQLVSKATGGEVRPKTSAAPVRDHADGKPLRKSHPGTLSSVDIRSQPLVTGAKLFSDRDYVAAELPTALTSAHFLPVAMNGQKTITCVRKGTVFFLTPMFDRNRDTAAQSLMDQGFERVALPEVPLFHPGSPANYCTLFQKDCAAGEIILIGKWALPLFLP
jgi:hypothetical protein